jgi:transposase
VALIGKLYEVERRIRGTAAEHRHAVRLEKSQPILDEIKTWLDDKATKVLPKGLLGEAIQYTRKQWPILVTFLQDGHLEIDNNLAENAIRPFAVGRKAWLFSVAARGVPRPVPCSIRWWKLRRRLGSSRAPTCITCSRTCRR